MYTNLDILKANSSQPTYEAMVQSSDFVRQGGLLHHQIHALRGGRGGSMVVGRQGL